MSDQKYYQDFDDFLAENPNINPEWREFMEPVIQGADEDFFNFVMSYVFM